VLSQAWEGCHHRFGCTRAICSAVNLFFKLDLDRAGCTLSVNANIPTDELCCTLMHSGMATRLREDSVPSEVLLDVHVRFLDERLHDIFEQAIGPAAKLEIACVGWSNLNLWLTWLRGEEHFELCFCDIETTQPPDAAHHQLPAGVGCLQECLTPAIKKSRTLQADVVIAYTTGSGLSPGLWYDRILALEGLTDTTAMTNTRFIRRHASGTQWDSYYLCSTYLWPSLTQQWLAGEPTLHRFDGSPGSMIPKAFYSSNSWCRGGDNHVSRKCAGCHRKATPRETDEHGRWRIPCANLSMQMAYRQWLINDRVSITLCCQ